MTLKIDKQHHYRLLCVDSGSLTAHFQDRLIFVPSKHGLWIRGGDLFEEHPMSSAVIREISLEPSDLPPHLCSTVGVHLSSLASAMAEHVANPDLSAEERQRAGRVLVDLLEPAGSMYEIALPTEEVFLRAAVDVLKDPTELHRLTDYSPMAGMKTQKFARLFRAHVGVSWAAWCFAVKMYFAASLLNQGLSVADVSYAMGYKGPSTFGTAFTRFFGENAGVFKLHETCESCGHRRYPRDR